MTQVYSDPTREDETHALPDVEVFHIPTQKAPCLLQPGAEPMESGYYWWSCFPGCLPDGDPVGPFETEAEAIADARGE